MNIFTRKIFFIILISYISNNILCAQHDEKVVANEQVIAQMNYCINSLTNIVHNKSMIVLEHEIDQLINNLTMEQIIGLYEIAEFRSQLLEHISLLQITEEERNIIKRVNSMKRDNLMSSSISNALNPTMLIFSGRTGVQVGFQALLTLARTAVEFKSAQGEQNIEELQAMWDLKKDDLKEFMSLRKDALDLVFKLYQKYNLNENDRLTEASATNFNKIIMEVDPYKRMRLLLDNNDMYGRLMDYHYHLGMTYIDIDDYQSARPILNQYLNMYNQSPIFRYDEKTGCVVLSKLTFEKNLDDAETEALIQKVLINLPNNGAALLQCALIYFDDLNNPSKAFHLLRAGIDNISLTDKDAVMMLITNLLPEIKKHPEIHSQIVAAISKCKEIDINSYISFIVNNRDDKMWGTLAETIKLEDVYKKPWYRWFTGREYHKKTEILFPDNFSTDIDNIQIFIEKHGKDKLKIEQNSQLFVDAFKKEHALKKVSCFKSNKSLIYIFLDPLGGDFFSVKKGLDYEKIKMFDYPGMDNFVLTESDLKDIVTFCKKNKGRNNQFTIIKSQNKKNRKSLKLKQVDLPYFDNAYSDSVISEAHIDDYNPSTLIGHKFRLHFVGDSLMYQPSPFYQQSGNYLKLFFDGSIKTTLTYSIERDSKKKLIPYSVESNGVISFFKPQVLAKYEPIAEKSFWSKLKFWKSADDVSKKKAKVELEKEDDNSSDKLSFWSKLKLWKSNDDISGPKIKDENEIKDNNSNKSSFWSKLKFWKSSDDNVSQESKDESKMKNISSSWWNKLKFWKSNEKTSKQEVKDQNEKEDSHSDKPSLWERLKFWK